VGSFKLLNFGWQSGRKLLISFQLIGATWLSPIPFLRFPTIWVRLFLKAFGTTFDWNFN